MFSSALDLTCIRWRAEQSDGITIQTGRKTYEKIDRTKLESFSLTMRNKPILTVSPKNRTLVVRYKVRNRTMLSTNVTERLASFWIVALLAKAENEALTQHVSCEFDPKWNNQLYDIDSEETSIHYLFQNGKTQVNTKFGTLSPFNPIHLRSEEFKQLMGVEDPTMRKIDFIKK